MATFSARPLLIAADAAEIFEASIEFATNHEHADEMFGTADNMGPVGMEDDFWSEDGWASFLRPYTVVNGVLQVPVQGTLLNRFPYQLGRWATGYDYIERAVARGMEDPEVSAIALVIDSPGGEVAGCFELVDKLYEWRDQKTIRTFAADHAYSAAYAIASVGDQITVTRSGGTGSVGVVTAHVDMSKALDKMGVKVTFIHAGKHKVDGNPYEPLPEAVKDRIQARVDKIYGVFTSTVARNRDMDEDAIRGTDALTYDAEDSIEIGFADRIGALEDEMIAFMDEVAETEDELMTTKPQKTPAASATDNMIEQAAHEQAVEAAKAEGMTEGATAERARISAILGSDEGKARPKAAMSTAMKTEMSVDEAKAFLGDLPEEKAETATSTPAQKGPEGQTPFDNAMGSSDNPGVGAGGDDDDDDETMSADAIVADFRAATGAKPKKTA